MREVDQGVGDVDRMARLKAYVNDILAHVDDVEERRWGCVHLYGVSMACALIAAKRGEDVELAALAGLLHDLSAYKTMIQENHAHHSSALAYEAMTHLGLATEAEKETICTAIKHHSDKGTTHSSFDEVLKDADVLQHCLNNPAHSVLSHERLRWEHLRSEFGLSVDIPGMLPFCQ